MTKAARIGPIIEYWNASAERAFPVDADVDRLDF